MINSTFNGQTVVGFIDKYVLGLSYVEFLLTVSTVADKVV